MRQRVFNNLMLRVCARRENSTAFVLLSQKNVFLRKFEAAQGILVAQVGNLPYRRLAVGRASEANGACGLPIRDTADWEVCATLVAALPRCASASPR